VHANFNSIAKKERFPHLGPYFEMQANISMLRTFMQAGWEPSLQSLQGISIFNVL
jgi:hypothetical protein